MADYESRWLLPILLESMSYIRVDLGTKRNFGVIWVLLCTGLGTDFYHFFAAFAVADALWPANGMARCSSTK
jgi:hypothetical protein